MVSTPIKHGYVPSTSAEFARVRTDLFAARSALRLVRSGPQRHPAHVRAAAADLLECLEAYAAALLARRLPLPRRVRDELRLRRLLAGEPREGSD
jgi:hypothetical protein